jgi:hypothetical protein
LFSIGLEISSDPQMGGSIILCPATLKSFRLPMCHWARPRYGKKLFLVKHGK